MYCILVPLVAMLWAAGVAGAWLLPLRPFILILALALSVTSGAWACWAACARHEAERRAMVRLLATIAGDDPESPNLHCVS
jgi:hypothetical protein